MKAMRIRDEAGTGQVKDSYEKAWANTRARLERHIEDERELSSILAHEGRLRFPGVRDAFWQRQPAARKLLEGVFAAHDIEVREDVGLYLSVVDGRYLPASGLNPIEKVSKAVAPETTVVMELGSGWSANLFQVYVWHGRRRSRDLRYIGAEYTESGRDCGRLLAEHDGHIGYHAQEFDWTQPDMSFLGEIERPVHLVAFSHHSIEQVEDIDPDIYAQIGRYADSAKVFHFEPVGWQRDSELLKARRDRDTDHFNGIRRQIGLGVKGRKARVDLTTTETQIRGAAWWSFARRHNINLLEAVASSAHARVANRIWDFDSLSNPLNPSTLLELDIDCG